MTSSDPRPAASGFHHEFAEAYQYAPIGLCTLDRDLRYVHINKWLAQLNGHSVEEHLGRTLSEILPDVAEHVASQMRRVLGTGDPIIDGSAYVETAAHPGEKRLYQHNFNAIRSAGTIVGISCVVEDITERAEIRQKLLTAQDDERRRIARELHDEMGQSLTALLVGIRRLAKLVVPEGHQSASELTKIAETLLDNIARVARGLHPSSLENMGFAAAIEQMASGYAKRHGFDVRVNIKDCGGSLTVATENTLYRAIQEALTNTAKHADAESLNIVVQRRTDGVRATVDDDGRGFDVSGPITGVGLHGIRERVALHGGTLTVESNAGEGTTLFIQIPVQNHE